MPMEKQLVDAQLHEGDIMVVIYGPCVMIYLAQCQVRMRGMDTWYFCLGLAVHCVIWR